jgi:hypothetical protein
LLGSILLEDAIEDELFLALLRLHHQTHVRRDFACALAEPLRDEVVARVVGIERWSYSNH